MPSGSSCIVNWTIQEIPSQLQSSLISIGQQGFLLVKRKVYENKKNLFQDIIASKIGCSYRSEKSLGILNVYSLYNPL